MDATTVAVDLAKDVFEVALADRAHRIVDRKSGGSSKRFSMVCQPERRSSWRRAARLTIGGGAVWHVD
jgi:hypothetical protein